MKYRELTKYEQLRFNSEEPCCMYCNEKINKWRDNIVMTKYRDGLNTVYSKYHEICFYMNIYSETLANDAELKIIDRG